MDTPASPRRPPDGPQWSTWHPRGQCKERLPILHFALCWIARVRYVIFTVIPGRAQARTLVRNCAPENLEISGLVLRTIPE
jgi:hypothetical protein